MLHRLRPSRPPARSRSARSRRCQRRSSTIFRPPGRGRRPAHGREEPDRGRRRAVGRQHRVRDDGEGPERPPLALRVARGVQGKPGLSGIPFMGPWANRLDEQAFYANGKRYAFDMELGNVRGAIPIHGFLSYDRPMEGRRGEGRRHGGVGDEPPRVLSQSDVGEAVSLRPHHRDDLSPAGRRRSRCVRGSRTCRSRTDAGVDRVSPVFSADRFAARRMDDLRCRAKTHWMLAQNKIPTGETQPIDAGVPESRGRTAHGPRSRSRLQRSGARRHPAAR